jgi:hypothetical protein
MKRMMFAVVLIIVIILLFAILVFTLQSIPNRNDMSGQSDVNVKITNFSVDSWNYLGGVTFDCWFNVTIENRGLREVNGLVLDVKVFNNNTEMSVGNYFVDAYENGTIKQPLGAGEVKQYQGSLLSGPSLPDVRPNNVLAIVSLNNTVLDELWNQINNVKITAVKDLGGFSPVVGLLIESKVNVTIRNNGVNPVSGLILTVTLVHNSTGAPIGVPYWAQVDTLQAGESREIAGLAFWSLQEGFNDADGNRDAICVVTLTLNDVVLDVWIEAT